MCPSIFLPQLFSVQQGLTLGVCCTLAVMVRMMVPDSGTMRLAIHEYHNTADMLLGHPL
jgi:hypothetical protein